MARRRGSQSFRIGKVRGDLRGSVWYLTYHEEGRRRRPRVGPDESVARRMAAEVNAQLEGDVPTLFGFEPVMIEELQQRWLDHHEHVLRSAVRTIVRYRCATRHLIEFVALRSRATTADRFTVSDAEAFARHLRTIRVAPNGHPNSRKRPLLGQLGDLRHDQDRRITAYRETELTNAEAHDLVIRALDADVLPVTRVPTVLAEWRSPSYPEFTEAGPTVWRLFNAVTESLKARNLPLLPLRTQALHGLLDTACGLAA